MSGSNEVAATTSLRERAVEVIARLRAPALMFDSDRRALADALEAALSTPPAGEWVLVPRKLTESMTRAFATSPSHPDGRQRLQLAWDAMLAASTPEPATQEETP